MEIQVFLLCNSVVEAGPGSVYNGQLIGLHSFYPVDGKYPFRFALPYYMLLRREHRAYDEQISLRFDLLDQDGRLAGEPAGFGAEGVFPAGARFFVLTGKVEFAFPAQGDYRLDVTADEHGHATVYPYNIEITERPDA